MTPTCISPPEPLTQRIERARAAASPWFASSVRQRLVPVDRFRLLLVQECDAFCAAIAEEVGKASAEVIAGEVLPTADACRFLLRNAPVLLRPRRVPVGQRPLWLWGQSDTVHRKPRGVLAIIGTWNFPLLLNAVQILQALVAGNAVVWKPSEVTTHFAELLQDMLLRAGFPADLVQVLPATREMGPALAEAAIDHVVFTGSVEVGRKLAARLGERLISSTLELSGCDAQFVLDDADVTLAARAAWFGCTINRGQTCIAVRRAFVQRTLYPTFCDTLRGLANLAPVKLVLPGQCRQAERLVEDALAQGARLLLDSPSSKNDSTHHSPLTTHHSPPTVLVDARPEMEICREASFAPVMAVLPFESIEEALLMEQACPFALGASVFTRDTSRGAALASRLRAGAVTINDVVVPTAHPATPFGGRGDSGWGVTQGAEGLLEMTVPQTVSVRGGTFRPHFDSGEPAKLAAQEELLRGMMQARHGPTILARLRGWWRLIRAARRITVVSSQ
jgi:acyl-CoA reductase-like NAD-dependent aldehyde dehydrogenase